MAYFYKCFLWENGQKSTEYTDHFSAPFFFDGTIEETQDNGEIILENMPIASKSAFPPKTKFRVERYKIIENDQDLEPDLELSKTWDLVVEHDDVEEYAGCPDMCSHHINCIGPGTVMQGIHVDNIALTYELQDVTLNYRTVRSDTEAQSAASRGYENNSMLSAQPYIDYGTFFYNRTRVSRFQNTYTYRWENMQSINGLYKNMDGSISHEITFDIPKLYCYGSNGSSWVKIFEMNTQSRIYEIRKKNLKEISRRMIIGPIISGPKSTSNVSNQVWFSSGNKNYIRQLKNYSNTLTPLVSGGLPYTFDRFYESAGNLVHTSEANASYPDSITFSTTVLSPSELSDGEEIEYKIETRALSNCFISAYGKKATTRCDNSIGVAVYYVKVETESFTTLKESDVYVQKSLRMCDLSQDAEGGPFLVHAAKYSCYDMFRKAVLSADTYLVNYESESIDDIELPVILDSSVDYDWRERLMSTKMNETIFQSKNLWEIFQQIGYYIHAVPYVKFAQDGTDRFALGFKQLGGMKRNTDESTKITIYNSLNMQDYFTAFDCYVTNLFSPQNIIDEWVPIKTSDESFLISNNTAEIKLNKPITELLQVELIYKPNTNEQLIADITSRVFEQSVYNILTNDDPISFSPAKGNSLYYKIGDSKILGLNYVPPSVNSDSYMALKTILRKEFGFDTSTANLRFSGLLFHVRYRTQDELRVTQVRPNIDKFMRNSSYEKYPHHEQYFGQQDKIIDSERLGSNLFGQLVRCGNAVYQRQEYAENEEEEKEEGQLVELYGDPYYVSRVENEYYRDGTFQKVTYSKDFNNLSPIVTIPSEPRFYEVSEQSNIRREIRAMEFIKLSANRSENPVAPRFINPSLWQQMVCSAIFYRTTPVFPNYAYTKFFADRFRRHTSETGAEIEINELFPSSEIDRTDPNNLKPKSASDHTEHLVPVLHYPFRNGLVFTWDMADNFKSGDFVDTDLDYNGGSAGVDGAYYSLQPMRYCDVMGRADLLGFKLIYKPTFTYNQAMQLPKFDSVPTDGEALFLVPSGYGIALDKDCREALSFNLQINWLYHQSEGFITYSSIWTEKLSALKMCLYDNEKSMFDENVAVITGGGGRMLADDVQYEFVNDNGQIRINITTPVGVDMSEVKSIVLYEEDPETTEKFAYIARNVGNLTDADKLQSWYIYPVFSDN